jgi:hypothetical protein
MSTDEQSPQDGLEQHMPAVAAEFAQTCKNAGLNLDFQVRTLPFVDKFVAGAKQDMAALAAKQESIGAYLGEVIRRDTGGVWYIHEGNPALDVGEHQVDPIAAIAQLIDKGRAQFGDVKIENTKQYCEWVIRLHRQWLERTLLGTADSMATLRTSMTTDARLAGSLVAQAQGAVQAARFKWNESLDFTPDSIDGVERVLGKMHNHYKFAAPGTGPSQEQIDATAKTWGIYTGEVIRRYYGGQWSAAEDGSLSLSIGETRAFPVAKARKRIVDGPTENMRYYFSSMLKLLQG